MNTHWDDLLDALRARAPVVLTSLTVNPHGGDKVEATLTLWSNWERNVASWIGSACGPEKWVAESLSELVIEKYPIAPKKED